MDLQSSLQELFIGSQFKLLEFTVFKGDPSADIYVDVVYIGKATTIETNGRQLDDYV